MKTHRQSDTFLMRVRSLFAATLRGGLDDDAAWKAIRRLHWLGSALVFNQAKSWCSYPDARKRARGAAVLAQLFQMGDHRSRRRPTPIYREESYLLIANMLAKESNEDVISEAIAALGYIYNPAAAPLIAPFADHSNPEIRYSVAHSLGHFADESASILGLTKLIDDPDKEVRDWAIFGIGTQGNADSEDLRLRFIAHLDDPYFDARQEAAAALAKRHDIRVVAPLISMLKRYGDIVCLCEAARDLLHIEDRPIDWCATEYVAALEAAFPEQATNTANPPL